MVLLQSLSQRRTLMNEGWQLETAERVQENDWKIEKHNYINFRAKKYLK